MVMPVPAKSAVMRSIGVIGASGLPECDIGAASAANNSPDGRTACSICHSAPRRSWPNDASAPISARTLSSSRRTPVRRIISSIDPNFRGSPRGAIQSWAQRLQKHDHVAVLGCGSAAGLRCGGAAVWGGCGAGVRLSGTHSNSEGSSQPHFGQSAGGAGGFAVAAAIARPAGSRRPATYRKPRRTRPSG